MSEIKQQTRAIEFWQWRGAGHYAVFIFQTYIDIIPLGNTSHPNAVYLQSQDDITVEFVSELIENRSNLHRI